jgi:arginase
MQKLIDCFLYAYGNAAGNPHCEEGALHLKQALEKHSSRYHWHPPLEVTLKKQKRDALDDVVALTGRLATAVQQAIMQKHFFITLGGDHSCAIGSWHGALHAIEGDIGLIWFDAHMDAHTFETTPSNNIHGMPLAVLLGRGDPALTKLSSKKLKPENVVLIGIRSYEEGEQSLLQQLGVKIFYMDDIKKYGLQAVFEEALQIVTKNTDNFGISIDLDGFDPQDAPGVGSRENDGVRATEFLAHFSMIAEHPKLIGMDIVEFNPRLDDKDRQTEQLAVVLCEKIGH